MEMTRVAFYATSHPLTCSSRIDLDIPVTRNTWLLLHNTFTMLDPVQVNGVDKQDQFVQFTFNDGYTLVIYDAGVSIAAWPPATFIDDPKVIYVPIHRGYMFNQNIIALFEARGVEVPGQLTLNEIRLTQEMETLASAPADTQTMLITLDAVRLINISEDFNFCQ